VLEAQALGSIVWQGRVTLSDVRFAMKKDAKAMHINSSGRYQ
jgi:hypothetical protein